MKKILFVASVVKLHIMVFHLPYLKMMQDSDYEVHVCACNDYDNKEDCIIPYCEKYFDLPFDRNPFGYSNIIAYKSLKRIINNNEYEIIHCHTPIGGVLTRLAAKKARKINTRVIYTAHGFHFFKGAPLKNWLLYYPVEKWLSRYTDTLITLNKEDYQRSLRLRAVENVLMSGVGIETNKFGLLLPEQCKVLRKKIGVKNNENVLMYVGELTKRKHQDFLIKVISKLLLIKPGIHLVLVGDGDYTNAYKKLGKDLGVEKNVHFLGFCDDIAEWLGITDIYVSSSIQEGLPVNIMEAMASGLPVVSFNIRGNKELIKHGKGGFLIDKDCNEDFQEKILLLLSDTTIMDEMAQFNINKIKQYNLLNVIKEMKKVYGLTT